MATTTGITTTAWTAAADVSAYRRRILKQYPNGKSPLFGVTAALGQRKEATSGQKFYWEEARKADRKDELDNISTTVVFADPSTPYAALSANFNMANNTSYCVKVKDSTQFSPTQVIEFTVYDTAGTAYTVQGIITTVVAASHRLVFYTIGLAATISDVDHDGAHDEENVQIIGIASAEGDIARYTDRLKDPVEAYNYTQIFRNDFQLTSNALKEPTKYDRTGPYNEKARQAFIEHGEAIEMQLMFGRRDAITDPISSKPKKITGGIKFYLDEWEKADSDYRGGSGAAAITANSTDEKRIINLNNTATNTADFEAYMERIFRYSKESDGAKLCFCGNGFIQNINKMYKNEVVKNVTSPFSGASGFKTYILELLFGEVYFKTHPLYNQYTLYRNNGLFLDMPSMQYTYVTGRDTRLLTDRQPNNADYIEDEFFTECGLELQFPEAFMYMQNLNTVV